VRVGLQVQRFDWPGGPEGIGRTLADVARAADEAGFHSLWVMDHLFQMPMLGPPDDPCSRATPPWAFWPT